LSSRFAHSSNFQSSIETGVHIACKEKPNLTLVPHHAETHFFCLMLCLIARPSRFGFRFTVCFWLLAVCAVDFRPGPRSGPARGLTRPDPARPLARAPGAPTSPHARPLSPSHFFPRSNFHLLLFHLSSTPFALGVIRWTVASDRRIPRWAPLPFPSPLPPSSLHARGPSRRRPPVQPPRVAPVHPPRAVPFPRVHRLKFSLISFKFRLIYVLRHATFVVPRFILSLYLLACCVTRFVARRFI
jgi:hypothetical protein